MKTERRRREDYEVLDGLIEKPESFLGDGDLRGADEALRGAAPRSARVERLKEERS